MFVKLFDEPFTDPTEISLGSIDRVIPCEGNNGSEIEAQSGDYSGYSKHSPETVRTALTLYAGFLNGQGETQASFPLSNTLEKPRTVSGYCLDLTQNDIVITEIAAPIDEQGRIRIDRKTTSSWTYKI